MHVCTSCCYYDSVYLERNLIKFDNFVWRLACVSHIIFKTFVTRVQALIKICVQWYVVCYHMEWLLENHKLLIRPLVLLIWCILLSHYGHLLNISAKDSSTQDFWPPKYCITPLLCYVHVCIINVTLHLQIWWHLGWNLCFIRQDVRWWDVRMGPK